MFINEWFVPSVLVALTFQKLSFCFGATMAVRRPALESVGGFEALASHLADDYTLGKLISQKGFRVVLSPYVVDNIVFEQDLKALFRHELRWARTVFSVRALGYALSVVTHAVPIAVLTSIIVEVAVGWRAFEFGVVAIAVLLRISLHFMVRSALDIRQPAAPWLVPIRDILSFAIWGASFFEVFRSVGTVSWP
jgi:ceramide glucosyltransferase